MSERESVSEASVYRLSLYHCYFLQLLRAAGESHITSSTLAQELGFKEETVRRDLSYVGGVGRPGSGYDVRTLFNAIHSFLGLIDEYPVVAVGRAQMLEALTLVFPAENYGLRVAAYYSEADEDTGKSISGLEVRPMSELPQMDRSLGISVALLACTPPMVNETVALLAKAGVRGIFVLTPAIHIDRPEGITITHVRIPCDVKSLACRCRPDSV